ncbi:hypothetical protein [Saccharolobus islandicus]|uniref:Archaeal Type IV pilin N-terminal domain-containing protein n=2 Tax=Saccharolobus islandicus TaxID=43080 RepID=C3MTH8_SACI4|nr:hypothetical protein [Sulfolobus islandicus]ACP39471.1 conserved hypothetical protein [Sulfolobus islandicus M.14.25]ADX84063.1 conserved hypothetical protein [Sulfolobus islandicus HVE10/4]WCM37259.1 hypothetical protein GO599_07100 [Sulfolobus islandicus]
MRKGLSDSLTMMIVILASVILAITVISILFGYLGYFGSSYGEVRQIGTALITQDGKLNITLENSFSNAKIVGVIYSSTLHNINYPLLVGQYKYTINTGFTFPNGLQTVTLTLVIVTNQNTIYVPVEAQLVNS